MVAHTAHQNHDGQEEPFERYHSGSGEERKFQPVHQKGNHGKKKTYKKAGFNEGRSHRLGVRPGADSFLESIWVVERVEKWNGWRRALGVVLATDG